MAEMPAAHCDDRDLVVTVIVNWNRPLDTIECIESLAAVTYENHRTIVVDNGSDNGSVEQIRAATSGVEILANRRNLGFSGGVNVGITRALELEAAYIFLLNNDAVVAPDFLEPLVAACQADRSIGIAGPAVYRFETGEPFSVGGWPRRFLPLLVRGVVPSLQDKAEEASPPRELAYVWGQGMLIRRQVVERVGLFDPDFFMYYEDCDFCLRTSRRGFRIVYVPQSRVWHKVARSTSGDEWSRWRHKVTSMFHFHLKHGRWGIPQALLQTVLTLIAIGVREIGQGNWRWVGYPLARLRQSPRR
jgi:GT2 family glycosyltransferase